MIFRSAGVDCFIDGPDGSPRNAVHILYANEKVRAEYITPSADVTEIFESDDYDVLDLEPLVRMMLESFRTEDKVLLSDMLSIALMDKSWIDRLLPLHAERLQQLIDDPDG